MPEDVSGDRVWGSVSSIDPLLVRFAGDDSSTPVLYEAASLADDLKIGDIVSVQQIGTQWTVHMVFSTAPPTLDEGQVSVVSPAGDTVSNRQALVLNTEPSTPDLHWRRRIAAEYDYRKTDGSWEDDVTGSLYTGASLTQAAPWNEGSLVHHFSVRTAGTAPAAVSYELRYRLRGGTWSSVVSSITGTTRNITGLSNITQYEIQVRSVAGDGTKSPWVSVFATTGATPLPAAPGAPVGLRLTPGETTIGVTWSAPSTGGTPTAYRIRYRAGSAAWQSVDTGTSRSWTLTGLTAETTYTVEVTASNAGGRGAAATASATTTEATPVIPRPGTPQDLRLTTTAIATEAFINMTWNAPAAGGSVTGYRIRYRFGFGVWIEETTGATARSYRIDGLLHSSPYTVELYATGPGGSSPRALAKITTAADPSADSSAEPSAETL